MKEKSPATYIVLFDHNSEELRGFTTRLSRSESADILVAHSHQGVLDFVRRFKPAFCVIGLRQVGENLAGFANLVRSESCETQVFIVDEDSSGSSTEPKYKQASAASGPRLI